MSWNWNACLQRNTISFSQFCHLSVWGQQWGGSFWLLDELELERLPTAKHNQFQSVLSSQRLGAALGRSILVVGWAGVGASACIQTAETSVRANVVLADLIGFFASPAESECGLCRRPALLMARPLATDAAWLSRALRRFLDRVRGAQQVSRRVAPPLYSVLCAPLLFPRWLRHTYVPVWGFSLRSSLHIFRGVAKQHGLPAHAC